MILRLTRPARILFRRALVWLAFHFGSDAMLDSAFAALRKEILE